MVEEIEASLDELHHVVRYLEERLPPNAIIFLHGNLAAGKTTLTKAIARQRGIETEVTSPTFALQHCYGDGLYHYDLYRLEYEAFMEMGLYEEFEKPGWHLVEWGSDRLKTFLEGAGYHCHSVTIEPSGEKRNYRIDA